MNHENPTSTSLFVVDPSSTISLEAYTQVTAKEANVRESWFRDCIAQNPELVISACRRAGLTHEQWFCWGKEVAVTDDGGKGIGSIDVLLVSETGRIGIVETKLSYNPEKRRSVVGQVLDYALNLGTQDLDNIAADLPRHDGIPVVEVHSVHQRLQDGDYLLIVAGDVLDPRAVRLGQTMLGAHMLQRWDLALVDLSLYTRQGDGSAPAWLLVPALRGTLIAETRHVFRIKIEGLPQGAEATVTPVRPAPRRLGRTRWDETSFKEALAAATLPPAFKNLGARLIQIADNHPQVAARFGTSKDGTLIVKRNGYGLLEFFLSGQVRYRPASIGRALPATISARYLDGLARLFGLASQTECPLASAALIAPQADAVVALVEDTLRAADAADS